MSNGNLDAKGVSRGQFSRAQIQHQCLRALVSCANGATRSLLARRQQRKRYLFLALFPSLVFPQDTSSQKDASSIKGTLPRLLYKVEPEYTENAKKSNLSGKALLSLVVDIDGVPKEIKVISPLADGLAEQAIKAVSKWRFQPGTKNGLPVWTKATVEVNFQICTSCTGRVDPTYERLESARGIYNVGIHQLRGDLDKKDVEAAFASMQHAASLGYSPAEMVLGVFYLEGTGTAVDAAKAADWFDRAAAQGNAQGEYQLGRLHETGIGTKANPPEALRMYLKAAEKNLPEAQCAAGMLLEAGSGVPQDVTQAVKLYRKSAEQGFSLAQYGLANIYWTGANGKREQVKALAWALIR